MDLIRPEMTMTARQESLPAVTAAGVVAILFGVCGAFGSLLSAVSVLLLPDLQTGRHAALMPPGFRAMSAVFTVFALTICVFGIFVGVGVIRRRDWARISILVWAGFMSLVCIGSLAFTLFLFSAIQNQLPNANPAEASKMMQFMRIFLAIFYGMPAAVGIWWIVLFTRKRVITAFTNPAAFGSAMDASGFPPSALAVPWPQKPKPPCPLPLAIFSVFLIFSSACMLLFLPFPLPASFPLFLFGHVFTGTSPKIFLGIFGVISGIAGFGMLKLKPWAFYTELVKQCLGLVNLVLTIFSPSIAPALRAAMREMMRQYPASPAGDLFLSDNYLRGSLILSLILCAAVVGLLLFQRLRFLDAAKEAAQA
jgi:hypothetical protein